MAIYEIKPERETVHGYFSSALPPILTISSGDTVCFRTLDAAWSSGPPIAPGIWKPVFPLEDTQNPGHALCGPIAIRDAQPGMTLAIQINSIRVGSWGWTQSAVGPGSLNWSLGVADQQALLIWTLDADRMIGHNQFGQRVTLRPFMGIMGMPPASPGKHSTAPPRFCGGNIDCKELVEGSTLYLPISVEQALFSVGDGHALQGDGEVGGSAIECPMERVDLTFHLHKEMRLTTPRARTPAGWITFGLDEDLDKAIQIALNAMLDLIVDEYHMQRSDALAMASAVVDIHITQIVNGVRGVHAILPHNALSQPAYPGEYKINSGGAAVDQFAADGYCYGGGRPTSTQLPIDAHNVLRPAALPVYQTGRYGNFTYIFPGLQPGALYTVRLHFVETFCEQARKRLFDIIMNDKLVLRDFDIFATAGGKGKVTIQELTATADQEGKITIVYLPGSSGEPVSNAIEVYPAS
jgi:acetamidase/formamidase